MKRIIIEAQIHDEHPSYRTPRNAHELIEALSCWVETSDFRWAIGDEDMHSEDARWVPPPPEPLHPMVAIYDIAAEWFWPLLISVGLFAAWLYVTKS